jgi:hypothetical protein
MDEDESGESPGGWGVSDVTLSPYEAQDLLDSGFSLVEPVPIPPVVISWAATIRRPSFCGGAVQEAEA